MDMHNNRGKIGARIMRLNYGFYCEQKDKVYTTSSASHKAGTTASRVFKKFPQNPVTFLPYPSNQYKA